MDIAANTAVIMRWVEAWKDNDLEAFDHLFSPTYAVNGHLLGTNGVKQSVSFLRTTFGNPHLRVDDLVAERDRVVLRWTLQGTHSGTFMEIPATGKSVTLTGTNIYRLVKGRIAENWESVDVFNLLLQLGAVVTLPRDNA